MLLDFEGYDVIIIQDILFFCYKWLFGFEERNLSLRMQNHGKYELDYN